MAFELVDKIDLEPTVTNKELVSYIKNIEGEATSKRMSKDEIVALMKAIAGPTAEFVKAMTDPLVLRILALEQQVIELKEKLR